jgi:nucleoside-diphosphate-sugar epimerase
VASIGRATCARLADEGAEVVGLDVDPAAAARVEATGAAFAAVDATDAVAVAGALRGCAGVVHAAARVSDVGAMADFVRVNVAGTRTVLDAARDAGVERVVHVSSVAVWGYAFGADLAEDAPARVSGAPYADTKAAGERLALRRGAAVVRPGDVYGPGSVPWVLRPLRAMRTHRFVLPDGGRGLMTPVYVDDLVDALVRALVHPRATGVAVTCWDGHAVPARVFFAHHARMLGRRRVATAPRAAVLAGALGLELAARLTHGAPAFSREAVSYVSRRATFPNDRARDLLGWAPAVGLDEGMRRTEAWLRAEGLL